MSFSSTIATSSKTKKRKSLLSSDEKKKLWNIFDTDSTVDVNAKQIDSAAAQTIECIYDNNNNNNSAVESRPGPIDELAASSPKITTSNLQQCSSCDSPLMIMEDGFPTCTNKMCGIMYTHTLDYSPEWRFYGAEDKNSTDPTRCGNPINPLLQESSFGCKILCGPNASYEMKRIRKWTEWGAMPHREKSLYDEFQFITIMAQNSGIPRIFIDDAMSIHKDISEQKMFRGMNRDGIKAASIYISCRLNGCPRTAHEIAEIFRLDKTSATNGCSMAVNIMCNIGRNGGSGSQASELCTTTPSSFIERYCSRLNMNQELTTLSKFIAQRIEKQGCINDNTPHSIAAGIVYFIAQTCNLAISKTDVKKVCGVSEVTINKCFKKMECMREKLIPPCIIVKYTLHHNGVADV